MLVHSWSDNSGTFLIRQHRYILDRTTLVHSWSDNTDTFLIRLRWYILDQTTLVHSLSDNTGTFLIRQRWYLLDQTAQVHSWILNASGRQDKSWSENGFHLQKFSQFFRKETLNSATEARKKKQNSAQSFAKVISSKIVQINICANERCVINVYS